MKLYLEKDRQTFTKLRNLSFVPEVDLLGQTLPVNEFTVDVDIGTLNYISAGQFAKLSDDQNNVWARYWITKIKHISKKIYAVEAKSILFLLDRCSMPAELITDTLANAINDCLTTLVDSIGPSSDYFDIDSSVASISVSGFCPEQSARERLQSLLMATGTYIKTWNDTKSRVLPAPNFQQKWFRDYGEILQANRVFWKPERIEGDNVSSLRFAYYQIDDHDNGGRQVEDQNGNKYWALENFFSSTIQTGSVNEVTISGNMMVNFSAQSLVMSNYKRCYIHSNNRVEADIINNGEYWPGDIITFQYDEEGKNVVFGYIQSVDFSFGNQARSALSIYPSGMVSASILRMDWTYNNRVVHSETLFLPLYYDYSINLSNKQVLTNGHLYVYAPAVTSIQGRTESSTRPTVEVIECSPVSDTNLITGEVTTDFTPHHITVVVPPKRQSYTEGDSVDYNGIVVKVYNASNQIIDTYSTPNGIIPYDDLVKNTSAVGIESNSGNVSWNVNSYTVLRDSFPVTVYAVRTLSGVPYFLASGPMVNMSGTEMVITDERAELDGNTLIVGE